MTEDTETPVLERGKDIELGKLVGICDEREGQFHDDIVSLKSLSMDEEEPGRLIVKRGSGTPTQSILMQDHIYRQAPNVLYGMPGGYLQKLATGDHADPALAAANFNHWVQANSDRECLLRFRGKGEDMQLRALLSGSWSPVPYGQVMELLKAKHGADQKVHIERFDDQGLVFNLVTKKLDRKQAKEGDVVEWGMRFKDSDVGLSSHLEMLPYSMTLWCTNGCTSMGKGASVRMSHSGKDAADTDAVMSRISQGMGMIHAYSEQVVEQMDAAEAIKLEEGDVLDDLFKRTNKRFDITKLEDKYARLGWDEEAKNRPEPNVLRFANAYTRAANAEELKYDSRFRLQAAGGAILEMSTIPRHRWN